MKTIEYSVKLVHLCIFFLLTRYSSAVRRLWHDVSSAVRNECIVAKRQIVGREFYSLN